MADIFISYAAEDRADAERLASTLAERGWSVWWDRELVPGQSFDQVIERELEAARCVVVLWSQSALRSEWVRNEAARALERDVLVPALIAPVKPPLEFRRRQTADLTRGGGHAPHPELQRLLRGIEALLAGRATVPAPAHAPPRTGGASSRAGTVAALAGVVLMLALGIAAYWRLGSAPYETRSQPAQPAEELSALVSGTYRGNVIADAKAGSRSDVTVTVSRIDARTIRVASDYARLGGTELELGRVGDTIQSITPAALLLLDTKSEPPRLSFNPGGEVAFEGYKQ